MCILRDVLFMAKYFRMKMSYSGAIYKHPINSESVQYSKSPLRPINAVYVNN